MRSVWFTFVLSRAYAKIIGVDQSEKVYRPIWGDLDDRPLPEWYDRAKIGIFIHWGIYSVPGYPYGSSSEWLWKRWRTGEEKPITLYMREKYGTAIEYRDFAKMFTIDKFDANEWAELFFKSGAKYVVLTAKHHDGFALFPSSGAWNSVATGPKLDLVKVLSEAVLKVGLKFGVYYSLLEWYNHRYEMDQSGSFNTSFMVDNVVFPDIMYLANEYNISVLWSDGEWDAPDTYWKSTQILAWLYNKSPVRKDIVVNDRWGKGTRCTHGGFHNCEDRYNPGHMMWHKWENAFTLDSQSWGFRRNLHSNDIMSNEELILNVVTTVSNGGNVLINVGPTAEGTIDEVFQNMLLKLGNWLEVNGEAIYGTSPWFHQRDTMNEVVWYTCRKEKYDSERPVRLPNGQDRILEVYAIFLAWPKDGILRVKDLVPSLSKPDLQVRIDLFQRNEPKKLPWRLMTEKVEIILPNDTWSDDELAWAVAVRPE